MGDKLRVLGLIGYPLGHSFSKGYFTAKFLKEGISNTLYENFPLKHIALLPQLLKEKHSIAGLNVTIPFKEQVLPYLTEVDPIAATVGAVNTIKIIRTGTSISLKGYNTDIYGFEESLKPLIKNIQPQALILGTGGSSKAISYVLDKLSIHYRSVSRSHSSQGEISYKDLNEEILVTHKLIINCSPVGMFPNDGQCPDIPYAYLGPDHILYDLIYNPPETPFLKKGKAQGCKVKNGLEMLQLQADKAWEIWNTGNGDR